MIIFVDVICIVCIGLMMLPFWYIFCISLYLWVIRKGNLKGGAISRDNGVKVGLICLGGNNVIGGLCARCGLIEALLMVPCICTHSGLKFLINGHLHFVYSCRAIECMGKGISNVLISFVNILSFLSCAAVNDTGLNG